MPKLAEGYTAKYGFQCLEKNVTRFEAEHALQISPEPLVVEDINQYIVMANREHNFLYLCFYLHHIERILNGRIYRFFHREGLYAYDPVRLLDYKLNCVSAIVDCCPGYDPDRGADFLTYAYYDIGNAILNCRRYEESGSFKNLDEYKTIRGIAWLYNKARDSRKKTIAAFMEKTGCTKKTAEDYLTAAHKNRGIVSIYDTILRESSKEFNEDFDADTNEDAGEDLSRDAGGAYSAMLWDSSWGGAVRRAHNKLDYRSQILIERRMAACMDCRCVLPIRRRPTWEDLATMFEGSTAGGSERAYKKAVQKLTQLLIEDGLFHTIVLKRKRQKKRKEKIAAATYLYQADSDGEWGEIQFDFEKKTAQIIRLADWDKMISQPFAKYAISYLLNCQNEKLPKETVISFEE